MIAFQQAMFSPSAGAETPRPEGLHPRACRLLRNLNAVIPPLRVVTEDAEASGFRFATGDPRGSRNGLRVARRLCTRRPPS